MAMWDQPFLFFRRATQGRGALLYHRYDGHYGLITPAESDHGGRAQPSEALATGQTARPRRRSRDCPRHPARGRRCGWNGGFTRERRRLRRGSGDDVPARSTSGVATWAREPFSQHVTRE